jgi:Flp pilus assembly protein TadG
MRLATELPRQPRRAATLVESTFVLSIALLFLFGLFEYARFVYLNQVMYNAAQMGARYAVAHTGDGTTTAQVNTVITNAMGGLDQTVSNFQISINYVNDSNGQTVAGSSWNQAPFGSPILVSLTCNYQPMMPTFLQQTLTSFPLAANCMMYSEAN